MFPTSFARYISAKYVTRCCDIRHEHLSTLLSRMAPLFDLIRVCPPVRKRAVSVNNCESSRCRHESGIFARGVAVRDNHIWKIDDVDAHLEHANLFVDVASLE